MVRREIAIFGVLVVCPVVAAGQLQRMVLALDPARSSVTLSGNVGGSMMRQQGTGSLTTRYSGGVILDFVPGVSVQFLPGGMVSAVNSGNWQPGAAGVAGSAPANYVCR